MGHGRKANVPSGGRHSTPSTPRTARPRKYDRPILGWLACHHAATRIQIAYRWWLHGGRGHRAAYRVLAELVERGLITSGRVRLPGAERGIEYVTLTREGWRMVGGRPPRDPVSVWTRDEILYTIQQAEMDLQRGPEGWALIPHGATDRMTEAIQGWLRTFERDRGTLSYTHLARIEHLSRRGWTFPFDGLWHAKDGAFRFVVPSSRGVGLTPLLARMPNIIQLPFLPVELVGTDARRHRSTAWVLTKWARRHGGASGRRVEASHVASFWDRPMPRLVTRGSARIHDEADADAALRLLPMACTSPVRRL